MPRLDKLIARNCELSRKQVTRLLRAGRVTRPDGEVLRDPRLDLGAQALPHEILIDDERATLVDSHHVIQHKPVGVVTALRDAMHETAAQLLRDQPLHAELRAVGRLDRDCSGLLIWTTDGTLVHKLSHPRYAVPREYHVALARPFTERPEKLVLDDGHEPRIVELKPLPREQLHPALVFDDEATAFAAITLIGGRFHEVKRIFSALDSHVVGLARVRYGNATLPADLEAGACLAFDPDDTFRDQFASRSE